jgi:hypothetical protein
MFIIHVYTCLLYYKNLSQKKLEFFNTRWNIYDFLMQIAKNSYLIHLLLKKINVCKRAFYSVPNMITEKFKFLKIQVELKARTKNYEEKYLKD